jgi:hypothetical protein
MWRVENHSFNQTHDTQTLIFRQVLYHLHKENRPVGAGFLYVRCDFLVLGYERRDSECVVGR